MANETVATQNPYADIAPALSEYTDKVLFGDVWERSGYPSVTGALSP